MSCSAALYLRFRTIAQREPAATALIAGDEQFTYGQLLQRVERCAAGLQDGGVQCGDAVVVALPNAPDFVVTALATFAAGAVLVPINPRYKADEIDQHLQLSQPRVIVHAPGLESLFSSNSTALRTSDIATLMGEAPSAGQGLPQEGSRVTGLYMFSSGSTGKSKRVTRTQQQVLGEFAALAERLQLQASDRVLCTVPLFHAHGFCNAMLAALLAGATLVLAPGEFNPRATLKLLGEQAITVFPAVPFMFQLMSDTTLDQLPDLTPLRWVISAGATLPPPLAQRFAARFGKPLVQLYGTTETGAISVQTRVAPGATGVGRPLSGTRIEIRDEHGASLPTGREGEIWVSAATATRAYDDLAELTEQCFKADWFFTGDLGHLDEQGELFITGRKKLLINVAGLKVDPLEVEAVLSRHPAVAEAVVVGVPQATVGEKVKAVLVLREGQQASERDITVFVAERLADYKVPKLVQFVSEIPRSALGKVLRKYL